MPRMSKKSQFGPMKMAALLHRNHEAISIPYEEEILDIHTRCREAPFDDLHASLKKFFSDKQLLLSTSHHHVASVCDDLKAVDKAHADKLSAEHLLDFLTNVDSLDAFSELLDEHVQQQDPAIKAKLLARMEATLHKVHTLISILHHSEIHRERGSPMVSDGLRQRHADCHFKLSELKARVRSEIEKTHACGVYPCISTIEKLASGR